MPIPRGGEIVGRSTTALLHSYGKPVCAWAAVETSHSSLAGVS